MHFMTVPPYEVCKCGVCAKDTAWTQGLIPTKDWDESPYHYKKLLRDISINFLGSANLCATCAQELILQYETANTIIKNYISNSNFEHVEKVIQHNLDSLKLLFTDLTETAAEGSEYWKIHLQYGKYDTKSILEELHYSASQIKLQEDTKEQYLVELSIFFTTYLQDSLLVVSQGGYTLDFASKYSSIPAAQFKLIRKEEDIGDRVGRKLILTLSHIKQIETLYKMKESL